MAAPTIRGTPASAAGSANATTTPAITVPAAAVAGDYAHFFVTFNTASTMTPPAGWNLISGGQQTGNNNYLYWYDKTLTAGDLGATVQATSSVTGASTASVLVYNGAVGLDALSTVTLKTTGSTSTTVPAVTPVVDDCLLGYVISSAALGAQNTQVSTSTPAGYAEDIDNSTTGPASTFWRGHAVGHLGLTGQAGVPQSTATATTGGGTTTTRDVVYAFTVSPVTVVTGVWTYQKFVTLGV